jgi:NAD-dependent DNA ligase
MTVEALKRIPGVGPSTAAALHQAGFTDVEAVANAQLEELTRVPGIGGARAGRLRAEAQNLVIMDGSADVAVDRDGPLAARSLEPVASADTGSPEIEGKKKPKKKRRAAARAKLDAEISALQSRLGELDAKADKARRRVKKAGSKKKRVRRREELDRLKRKVKKLRKRIDRLHRARADDHG